MKVSLNKTSDPIETPVLCLVLVRWVVKEGSGSSACGGLAEKQKVSGSSPGADKHGAKGKWL